MLPTSIEFLHEWGTHGVGDVVDTINPSDAEVLVLNHIARPAVAPTTATTTVVTSPPAAKPPRASAKKPRGG